MEQLVACGQTSCPAWMQKECIGWLDEVRRSLPTIVVHAQGKNGCDLADARVIIDGAIVSEKLDGRAIDLDPAVHQVRVESADGAPITREVVLVEGQKDRRVDVSWAAPGMVCGGSAPEPAVGRRPVPSSAWVVGAAGLTSLAGAAVLYAVGAAQLGSLSRCSPGCAPSDVDSTRRVFVVGDVLAGVAILSLGIAAWIYFDRPVVRARQGTLWFGPGSVAGTF
jgi:hypothetical protein